MKKIKNIWSLFFILFSFISIVFLYIAYLRYNAILETNKTLTSSYNKILYNSLDTTLSQNEVLLDTLAQELLSFELLKNKENSRELLQKALENSKYVIGFGLTDTKGNLLVTSANIDIKKTPNILTNDAVRTTFEKALKSDRMVVGRTYFFPPLNSWVIPVRKAVRDHEGNVLGVMIAGLVNNKQNNIFNGISLDDERTILLVHDLDKNNQYYRMYFSNKHDSDYKKMYENPLKKTTYAVLMENLQKEFHISSIDEIKDGKIYYTSTKLPNHKSIFLSISYNQKYKIWVVVSQKQAFVNTVVFDNLLSIFTIYFFIIISFVLFFRTIARKEKEKEAELIYKVNHDTLTGHYNRDYIGNDTAVIEGLKDKEFEVIFLDIDNFKNINDRFGHHVGDKVLVGLSRKLNKFFNSDDIIIRHGGDEFIVLSFSKIDHNELIELISTPCTVDELEFRLGVSIGISKYPYDSVNLDELFSMADIAMHEAKKVRNSYKYFNQEMYQKSMENSDIEHQLRHALDNDEFYMMYQPQISSDMQIYGVEALIRWENKKLGFVPPDKFISVAEDNGMILKIGEWVINRSLRDIKEIWEETGHKFHISLNISVIQFMEAGFLEVLLDAISEIGIDKTYVTLEITESLAIEEFNYVIPLLNKVRENGIEISLDDFGTGYSSLSILNKLPISEIKIDKQFVDGVLKNTENSLIKTIFSIGKNFSFKIVCEGTETAAQVEVLKEHGCDIFQGYHFSKPLKKDQLIRYIKDFYDRR
ncbi:bifunctional diguanylate cyclase/phosphodiesterase [Sulfurimonas marina]|uniref:EAL domain-containing protein n=1 Tax=Sulfurimonas marina TaxID=2590551 RepID=A0A7M1AVI7_9BACT|nr:EAL domain-containing protein [Sulfurimonas marina]QOP41447.1 EAL domain-containing protein [Sulfurimonas marina]